MLANISLLKANEELVLYNRNFNSPFVKASIDNLTNLSNKSRTQISIVASDDMEQKAAFGTLVKGEIDIFVGSPTVERENRAPMIYVPLDRGLLGFRLCLVHKSAAKFKSIGNPAQFIQKKLTVGLGTYWPDKHIFEENGFEIVDSPVHQSLFTMLQNKRFDCFSRSIIEIDQELIDHKNKQVELDTELVFVYPNADFIFINPN